MEKLIVGETYEFNLKFEGKFIATVIEKGEAGMTIEQEDGTPITILNFGYEVILVEDLFGNKLI